MSPETQRALELVVDGERTLRVWLRDVLLTFWEQGEGFSPKRPFGDSSWYSSIADALESAGFDDPDATVSAAISELFAEATGNLPATADDKPA